MRPTLALNQLRLRQPVVADAEPLSRLLSDPAVARMTLTIGSPHPIQKARAWLETAIADWASGGSYNYILTTPCGAVIGSVGQFRNAEGEAEIGYWIARDHWGRGYASAALKGFLAELDQFRPEALCAGHYMDNPASGRVLEKNGFEFTGDIHIVTPAARSHAVASKRFRRPAPVASRP
ncbi:MAG: GNAT family N-acetyltransferase [Maricaulaceae bacterium]